MTTTPTILPRIDYRDEGEVAHSLEQDMAGFSRSACIGRLTQRAPIGLPQVARPNPHGIAWTCVNGAWMAGNADRSSIGTFFLPPLLR